MLRNFKDTFKIYYPAAKVVLSNLQESEVGYELIPNKCSNHCSTNGDYESTYCTDELGLRKTPVFNTNSTNHEIRNIFFLGDSFTFGLGVADKDTLASKFEEKINSQNNKYTYRAYNLGVNGYSSDNTFLKLTSFIRKNPAITPAYAIIEICGSGFEYIPFHEWVRGDNGDLIKVIETNRHIDTFGRFQNGPKRNLLEEKLTIINSVKEFLRNYSYLYVFMGKYRKFKYDLNEKSPNFVNDNTRLSANIENGKNGPNAIYSNIKGIKLTQTSLEYTFKELKKYHITPIVLMVGIDLKDQQEKFLNFLKNNSALVIDVADIAKKSEKSLTHKVDGHWSAYGNWFIAKYLIEEIKTRGLLRPL